MKLGATSAALLFLLGTAHAQAPQRLVNSSAEPLDAFGAAVATDGARIVVGSPGNSGSANPTPGASGTAVVYEFDGTAWVEEVELYTAALDVGALGRSVAVDGDVVIVGASKSDPDYYGLQYVGVVVVYRFDGTNWVEEALLEPAAPFTFRRFGHAIAIEDDVIVVGDPSSLLGATETSNGEVVVFRHNGTAWIREAVLELPDPMLELGLSVSISDGVIAAGSRHRGATLFRYNGTSWIQETPPAPVGGVGVNYGQVVSLDRGVLAVTDWTTSALFDRSVVVFRHDGASWIEEAVLRGSSCIGSSLVVSGDLIATGHIFGNGATFDGRITLFRHFGSSWFETHHFTGNDVASGPPLGHSLALHDEMLVAGSYWSAQSGAGEARVFEAVGSSVPITLCNGDGGNQLACTNCPCMNNAPRDIDAGCLLAAQAPPMIGGCLNSAGTPARLRVSGGASVSTAANSIRDLRFALEGAVPMSLSVLLSGANTAPSNAANPCFGLSTGVQSADLDGLRCVLGSVARHGARTSDSNGAVGASGDSWGGEGLPTAGLAQVAGFAAGQTRYFQASYRDNPMLSCMRGINTTQAIGILFQP